MARYTINGKRLAIYGATRNEVRVQLTETLSQIDQGIHITPTGYTVSQSLRHTFATRALEAGMDIKVLSSILGHAQASTTLNLYAHALPDHKRQSMEKMASFYI